MWDSVMDSITALLSSVLLRDTPRLVFSESCCLYPKEKLLALTQHGLGRYLNIFMSVCELQSMKKKNLQ